MEEIDYSQYLKEELTKFVSKPKKAKGAKRYLETLINTKINELNKISELNEQMAIKKFILQNSLYFIKENAFKSDNYFELINNKIYKSLYELFKTSTEKQYKLFLESILKLDYGGDIIFIICDKICSLSKEKRFSPFDLFFRIIIKDNMELLQQLLGIDFPLEKNHEIMIVRLTSFTKMKNKIEFNLEDLYNLFRYQIKNNNVKVFAKEKENNKDSCEEKINNSNETENNIIKEEKGNYISINNKINKEKKNRI